MEKKKPISPRYRGRSPPLLVAMNRTYTVFHSTLFLALIYYRTSRLFYSECGGNCLAWCFISAGELLFCFMWILAEASRWLPVIRTGTTTEESKSTNFGQMNDQLPLLDVFICTADPRKEPPEGVMNTVISAMCLDYPTEKLSIYLSDDGGSSVTLESLEQALIFTKSWLPFCKKYNIQSICPIAYFREMEEDGGLRKKTAQFIEEEENMKRKYKLFKNQMDRATHLASLQHSQSERPPFVKIINKNETEDSSEDEQIQIPLLVYVSREERRNHHHHFKAGALNTLFRVSSFISNSPYVLALDCDMYCNNPNSAKLAMSFHLDQNISESLAFVQFPQIFDNIAEDDLYGGQLISLFKVMWKGCDGAGGPILSGTGFYIKRKALCGTSSNKSTKKVESNTIPSDVLQQVLDAASCSYEKDTQWGKEIGFIYGSVVEDFFTGLHLHYKGWKSMYCEPPRTAFLGKSPTKVNDVCVQHKRWGCGLLQVGFSRFCPLTYKLFNRKASLLHVMIYSHLAFFPLYSIAILIYTTFPQLCLLHNVFLLPKLSDRWSYLFLAIGSSSLLRDLGEYLYYSGSVRVWWNAERMWIIRSTSGHIFSCITVFLNFIGINDVNFELTSKVDDEEKEKQKEEQGTLDFSGTGFNLVPWVTLVILNMLSMAKELTRMMLKSWTESSGLILISFYIIAINYPLFGAIIYKKIPISTTIFSIALCTCLLYGLLPFF